MDLAEMLAEFPIPYSAPSREMDCYKWCNPSPPEPEPEKTEVNIKPKLTSDGSSQTVAEPPALFLPKPELLDSMSDVQDLPEVGVFKMQLGGVSQIF
jgi:hypothetical protein